MIQVVKLAEPSPDPHLNVSTGFCVCIHTHVQGISNATDQIFHLSQSFKSIM